MVPSTSVVSISSSKVFIANVLKNFWIAASVSDRDVSALKYSNLGKIHLILS